MLWIFWNTRSKEQQQQNLNLFKEKKLQNNLAWLVVMWCFFYESHLMLKLCYLVFEVADVLARICVVQLALDLSFFFLLVEEIWVFKKATAHSDTGGAPTEGDEKIF